MVKYLLRKHKLDHKLPCYMNELDFKISKGKSHMDLMCAYINLPSTLCL